MKPQVRERRLEAGLTQAALAEQCGVSRQTVIAVESGRYIPSTVLALKMARSLNATVEALFELEPGD